MTLRGKSDPAWPALVEEWKATQISLCKRMAIAPLEPLPRFVAGADCAFSSDQKPSSPLPWFMIARRGA